MLEEKPVTSIADLPPQRAANPRSPAEARARFFNTGNGFDVQLPEVPDHVFTEEPRRAFDPATPTGLIPCDLSVEMQSAFPATSPLVMARYARIRAGETLSTSFNSSGVIVHVMAGTGETACAGERVAWGPGDVILLPGGVAADYRAEGDDAVLWMVDNEPQFALENARAPAPGEAPTAVVHYPADEIARQIELIYDIGRGEEIAGSALIFSSEGQEASRNVLPTLTAAMNSLPPGVTQRPHRHNSVAVSLVIRGEGCFSMIDGRRKDWTPWATTVTPPLSVHSHHNEGSEQALFLIIQDGGIYYHARTMGFEFVDA